MKNNQNYRYFIIAAIVSSELYQATQVAREISITASNAKVLTLKANKEAFGFSAITNEINNLAQKTIDTAKTINEQALNISTIATESFRLENALARFEHVYNIAKDEKYLSSIDDAHRSAKEHEQVMKRNFDKKVETLKQKIQELDDELKTANILSTMSYVEASQAGKQYEEPLSNIAKSVLECSNKIQNHVKHSQSLMNQFG